MKISLIITTYNWPQALRVVLESVLSQTSLPHELIIADDGSQEETLNTSESVIGGSGLNWKHVRHGDSGIRQARVKNLAARYATGDYFIFIDHDVILHPDFIRDHLSFARDGHFLQGKRAFLPEGLTQNLLEGKIRFSPPTCLMPGLENRKNAIHYPCIGQLMGRSKQFQTSLRGCNLSMHKKDFLIIDGYDETFDQAWGREDSDVCYRLFHNGIRIKNLWFSALQYHLEHKVIKNRKKDVLDEELDKILNEKRRKALKGFSKMSEEGEIISGS